MGASLNRKLCGLSSTYFSSRVNKLCALDFSDISVCALLMHREGLSQSGRVGTPQFWGVARAEKRLLTYAKAHVS